MRKTFFFPNVGKKEIKLKNGRGGEGKDIKLVETLYAPAFPTCILVAVHVLVPRLLPERQSRGRGSRLQHVQVPGRRSLRLWRLLGHEVFRILQQG